MYEMVISTTGYIKEPAHCRYRVTIPIHMDYLIFDQWPHFLPANCRKSRSSLFSIFRRLISYACSASTFRGAASFLGRPCGLGIMPTLIFLSLRRYRFRSSLTCSVVRPKCSAISRFVLPDALISRISGSNSFTCVYFLFDIAIPPNVVLLSYIRGYFVYCLFLLDLSSYYPTQGAFLSIVQFYWFGALFSGSP